MKKVMMLLAVLVTLSIAQFATAAEGGECAANHCRGDGPTPQSPPPGTSTGTLTTPPTTPPPPPPRGTLNN